MDKATSDKIVARLEREYPLAQCTLDYDDAYHLLVSVRLAAQCTDERVNQVTPALFERYPTVHDMAEAKIEDVENYIRSCGFYHGKARDIVNAAIMIETEFNGRVPDNMSDLLDTRDPVNIEPVLRAILPPEKSNDFCHRMVLHGRAVCVARRPQCEKCVLRDLCRYAAGES